MDAAVRTTLSSGRGAHMVGQSAGLEPGSGTQRLGRRPSSRSRRRTAGTVDPPPGGQRSRGASAVAADAREVDLVDPRSEEHTSELQSLMRNSYAVFCLKKKYNHYNTAHK